ncbi:MULTISPECIES: heme ABC transporter ATP-binding protein [Methanosarcina]|uniref:Cobalamin import ATP-binding protein BtuD n=3 Tax=Methanosarcina barkeri TaxID=2208 RepID=A0A0E3QWC5_METBA|nr:MULTISPECIES: heme ABC transporter ATP-binding protein [Methanosarcina]AKB54998.1 Vitamin B12 ABC transporter, ATPase component BtuD [Methanosarcina barkeri MS]AKB56932.1 Vitamin B12 ABC transporter, ATPase component BtuD [Methanosarcina barkeri 227]AKJ37502.1 ABC transporter ATP-binding protein [Methanosarcina barkeri CM1]
MDITESVISVTDVDVKIGTAEILHKISASAGQGMFVGIIGPNGSGKSTLIHCMSRTLNPTTGNILIVGEEIEKYSRKELAKMLCVVPQESMRTFDFSVDDIVMMGRYPYQKLLRPPEPHDREACQKAMALTGISHLSGRSISTLSGGEWQRVLIARALAQETPLLLLDEPISQLDINHQIEILSVLQSLTRQGSTVICVIHDLNLASQYCDEIIMLDQGTVYAVGTPHKVMTQENIRVVFGLDVLIKTHPTTGKLYLLPIYHRRPIKNGGRKVHLICGGGSGTEIMFALHAAECDVRTGILSMNDADYSTSIQLGIPCIAEPPFSPITDVSRSLLEESIGTADLVVFTSMPFEQENVDNLRIVSECCNKPILLVTDCFSKNIENCMAGEAAAIVNRMISDGRAAMVTSIEALDQCLGKEYSS